MCKHKVTDGNTSREDTVCYLVILLRFVSSHRPNIRIYEPVVNISLIKTSNVLETSTTMVGGRVYKLNLVDLQQICAISNISFLYVFMKQSIFRRSSESYDYIKRTYLELVFFRMYLDKFIS